MADGTEVDTTATDTPEGVLAGLKEDASYFRPDLFAMYGVTRNDEPWLGWGMQFGDEDHTLFCYAGSRVTWESTSARALLARFRQFGEAHLDWLD